LDGGNYDDDGDDAPDRVIFGVTNNGFRHRRRRAGTSDDVLELIFSRQERAETTRSACSSRKVWAGTPTPHPPRGLKKPAAGFASTSPPQTSR